MYGGVSKLRFWPISKFGPEQAQNRLPPCLLRLTPRARRFADVVVMHGSRSTIAEPCCRVPLPPCSQCGRQTLSPCSSLQSTHPSRSPSRSRSPSSVLSAMEAKLPGRPATPAVHAVRLMSVSILHRALRPLAPAPLWSAPSPPTSHWIRSVLYPVGTKKRKKKDLGFK